MQKRPLTFKHEAHGQLAAYWSSLGQNGSLPSYKVFNPMRIARALPHIAYASRNDANLFQFRVWGTELTSLYGCDMTNRTVREFSRISTQTHFSLLLNLVRDLRLPIHVTSELIFNEDHSLMSEKCAFPLFCPNGFFERCIILETALRDRHDNDLPPILEILPDRYESLSVDCDDHGNPCFFVEPL